MVNLPFHKQCYGKTLLNRNFSGEGGQGCWGKFVGKGVGKVHEGCLNSIGIVAGYPGVLCLVCMAVRQQGTAGACCNCDVFSVVLAYLGELRQQRRLFRQ